MRLAPIGLASSPRRSTGGFIVAARKIVKTGLLAFGLLLCVTAAHAEPVTYVLGTPGVV